MSDATPTVVRNDDKSRYEVHVDGTVAGFTAFEVDDQGRFVYTHTEVDPAFSGRGLGGTLVGAALADAAARGETVVPVCPFVVKYLHGTEVPGLDVAWRPTADEGGSDHVDAPDA